jgi:cytochrome c553
MKSSTALLVAALIAGPALAAEQKAAFKPDLAKGQAISTQVCGACHTADGSRGSPANPILQGQHPEYLVKQLAGVQVRQAQERDHGRLRRHPQRGRHAPRGGVLRQQGGQARRGQEQGHHPPGRAHLARRPGGEVGAGLRRLPRPHGRGIPAQYPRLGGQHADYTEAQLSGFRAGTRANNAQMMTIAAKLNDLEIKAVSDYIAGLR